MANKLGFRLGDLITDGVGNRLTLNQVTPTFLGIAEYPHSWECPIRAARCILEGTWKHFRNGEQINGK